MEQEDMTELEKFHYYMQEAQRAADRLAGVPKGESSRLSQFIYGIQLLAEKVYGDN